MTKTEKRDSPRFFKFYKKKTSDLIGGFTADEIKSVTFYQSYFAINFGVVFFFNFGNNRNFCAAKVYFIFQNLEKRVVEFTKF